MDNRSGKSSLFVRKHFVWYPIKKHIIYILTDPRVKDWFMMSSPIPTLLLCLSYAYFSKSLGPKLMANRKPFQLRGILVYYNLFQTVFSAWIVYEVSVLFEISFKKKKKINKF